MQLAAGGEALLGRGPKVSLGARFWLGGAELKAASPLAPGAHLSLCSPAPSRGCLRFPRKTRRPGNRWGRSDRSPPCRRPPEPLPRPPNPPEEAVAAGGAPSCRLPPHLRVALFITACLFWASRLEPAAALC